MNQYVVSARKYRPLTFCSVVGQDFLTTTLRNAIQNHKLAHAYLFCGPRGVGKTTCARIFAKTINCVNRTSQNEACCSCESCSSFNEERSYNIRELDAASNNSVEDIRFLVEQIRIPPQVGNYKVYIIDEAHMLSTSAFNAFLKTLEEPPKHVVFILATTEKYKILPTILSRCQIYDFHRITVNDIVTYLEYVVKSEQVFAEKNALVMIAQKAEGGMRDALSILDQAISFSCGNLTYQSIINNLNLLDHEYYFSLSRFILDGDISHSLLLLDEILKKGFDGEQIIGGLSQFFRNLMVCKDPQTVVLFDLGEFMKSKYLSLSGQFVEKKIFQILELINECDLNYRISKNKRLLMELLLIRLCQLNFCEKEGNISKIYPGVLNSKKGEFVSSEVEQFPIKHKTSVFIDSEKFSLKKSKDKSYDCKKNQNSSHLVLEQVLKWGEKNKDLQFVQPTTSQEKFEYMAKQNANLKILAEKFQLE